MQADPTFDDLQSVRREFAGNRFCGLHASLRLFGAVLAAGETARCDALLAELADGGYPDWPGKDGLLLDLQDMLLLRQGGVSALLAHHELRRLADDNDAEAHCRLAILYQSQGHADAARHHYERSISVRETAGDPRARDLLLTLDHQQRERGPHPFFQQLWSELESGAVDVRRRFREAVGGALAGSDWRLGREAVAALEHLSDWETAETALTSPLPQVQTAAVAVLRRHGPRRHEAALIHALEADEAVVRWQAALALGLAGARSTGPLLERLRTDPSSAVRAAAAASLAPIAGSARERIAAALIEQLLHPDPNVRLAAAKSLGDVGDRDALADLLGVQDGVDLFGNSVEEAAEQAAEAIEVRFPPPPRIEETLRPQARLISARDIRLYRRRAFALALTHVLLGATLVGMANPWMAVGYLFYAAFSKGVIEPYAGPFDFFADKPCFTGKLSRAPRKGWLRSRVRPPLVFVPLGVFPTLCYGLLLLGGFSWWLLLAPLLAHGFLVVARNGDRSAHVCPACTARSECPLWKRFGNEVFLRQASTGVQQ